MPTRRQLLHVLGATALAGRARAAETQARLSHRALGRTGRWVTPFGLGGQAALQFPPAEFDVPDIIVRAVELGVNYLDTANAYGPSQSLYGEAFRRLRLAPWQADYDAGLRESLFVATKTGRRLALDRTRPNDATAVSELHRSLVLLFGDGKNWFPDEAYLDSIQIHNLTARAEVDQIYEGLEDPNPRSLQRLGALAGLLDYRDGTNRTGLNPDRRRLVRHIGISGHLSSQVLMTAMQRDRLNILDTLLVALNANDRRYGSHQFNAVPVARAKGMGIIAMKVFSGGGVYTGLQRQAQNAGELIRTVGVGGGIDPGDLVRYPLSVAGVATVIAGVTTVDRYAPERDQVAANLTAAVLDTPLAAERARIEARVAELHGTTTNYFQERRAAIVQPAAPQVERDDNRVVVRWQGALAAAAPLGSYVIWSGEHGVARLPFRPQLTEEPLSVSLPASEAGGGPFRVEASEKF